MTAQQALTVDFAALKRMHEGLEQVRREYEQAAHLAYHLRSTQPAKAHAWACDAREQLVELEACAQALSAYLRACNVNEQLAAMPMHERHLIMLYAEAVLPSITWADEIYTVRAGRSVKAPAQGVVLVTDNRTGARSKQRFVWGELDSFACAELDAILALMPQLSGAELELEAYCAAHDC